MNRNSKYTLKSLFVNAPQKSTLLLTQKNNNEFQEITSGSYILLLSKTGSVYVFLFDMRDLMAN